MHDYLGLGKKLVSRLIWGQDWAGTLRYLSPNKKSRTCTLSCGKQALAVKLLVYGQGVLHNGVTSANHGSSASRGKTVHAHPQKWVQDLHAVILHTVQFVYADNCL